MNYATEIAKLLKQVEEAGFQRGWQAARDALASPVPTVKIAGSTATAKKKQKKFTPKSPASFASTVEKRVKACIEANPGKTGAQIIKLLGEVNPRTVRTMLRRLKMRGKIEKSGEGWFTVLE